MVRVVSSEESANFESAKSVNEMDNTRRFETIADYNVFNNNETLHPLVSVVDLSKASPRQGSRMYFGFYTVFLKEVSAEI